MTASICSDRLFDKIADLRIVSDSLGFPDIVRLKSERLVHLAAALATSLANALLLNPVSGNRTLSDKTRCWIWVG